MSKCKRRTNLFGVHLFVDERHELLHATARVQRRTLIRTEFIESGLQARPSSTLTTFPFNNVQAAILFVVQLLVLVEIAERLLQRHFGVGRKAAFVGGRVAGRRRAGAATMAAAVGTGANTRLAELFAQHFDVVAGDHLSMQVDGLSAADVLALLHGNAQELRGRNGGLVRGGRSTDDVRVHFESRRAVGLKTKE